MSYVIRWEEGVLIVLDQRALPQEERWVRCRTAKEVLELIRTLGIRGAPLIGIATGYAFALEAYNFSGEDVNALRTHLVKLIEAFEHHSRPTAYNLFRTLDRLKSIISKRFEDVEELRTKVVQLAEQIYREEIEACRKIGDYGAELLPEKCTVLTHCNAGELATGMYGTALAVIYRAVEQGKEIRVIATETRPLLQGARLTCYELRKHGIPVTLIVDSAIAHIMERHKVDCVIVGADRITKDGFVANKIGTRTIAIAARFHKVPFYVAAPISTVDPYRTAAEFEIEYRSPEEVVLFGGERTAPTDISVLNPAFDVTPPDLISGIITDHGVYEPPFRELIELAKQLARSQ
mgnify:CR=1 FL=1